MHEGETEQREPHAQHAVEKGLERERSRRRTARRDHRRSEARAQRSDQHRIPIGSVGRQRVASPQRTQKHTRAAAATTALHAAQKKEEETQQIVARPLSFSCFLFFSVAFVFHRSPFTSDVCSSAGGAPWAEEGARVLRKALLFFRHRLCVCVVVAPCGPCSFPSSAACAATASFLCFFFIIIFVVFVFLLVVVQGR